MLFSFFMNLYYEGRAFHNIFHWGNYKDDRRNTMCQLMDFKALLTIQICFSTSGFFQCPWTAFVFLFSSVQLLSLCDPHWTTARQASLFITDSQTLPKLVTIGSLVPSNHLIRCRPLLFLSSIFPNIRVFSNESALQKLEFQLQHQSFRWTPRTDFL